MNRKWTSDQKDTLLKYFSSGGKKVKYSDQSWEGSCDNVEN